MGRGAAHAATPSASERGSKMRVTLEHDSHMYAYAEWLAKQVRYLPGWPPSLKADMVMLLPWGDLRIIADGVEAQREARDLVRRVSGPLSTRGME